MPLEKCIIIENTDTKKYHTICTICIRSCAYIGATIGGYPSRKLCGSRCSYCAFVSMNVADGDRFNCGTDCGSTSCAIPAG